MAEFIEGISHIDTDELKHRLENPNDQSIVLDIREREEYVEGHIPGIPLIPMGEIIDMIDDFDKNREYIFVCRSGRRSLEVAKFFAGNQIENVHNYAGGMLDWDGEVKTGPENILEEFDSDRIEGGVKVD